MSHKMKIGLFALTAALTFHAQLAGAEESPGAAAPGEAAPAAEEPAAAAPTAAVAAAEPTPTETAAAEPSAPAPEVSAAAPAYDAPAPLAKTPPPYSLPWQLRPIGPGNVVRSDTTVAAYETDAGSGNTVASTLLASYKVTPKLAPLVRIAVVRDAPPGDAEGATTFANPLVGAIWGQPLSPSIKLGLFAAMAFPIGTGGGNEPNMARASANKAGIAARSSMDNAMFAVNDHVLIGGADLAYVSGGFTVQGEMTVLQLTRVRGEDVQPDAHRTNFTSGVHVGWFAMPWLSLGGELRYQRWLSTPKAVEADDALRENATAAVGLRGHFKMSGKRWLRPGLSYTRGLDDPMSGKGYDIVQIDVPYAF